MRVTPLDIIQKQFTPGKRGYDSDEVRAFLESVRESMEELLKENQRLKDLVATRDREVAELRDNESDIKDTLILARRLSDDLKRTARREADVAVGEARLEADLRNVARSWISALTNAVLGIAKAVLTATNPDASSCCVSRIG
jgi:cell division initiation protein